MQTNVTRKHQIVRPLIASMMLLTSPSRAPKMEVRVCVPGVARFSESDGRLADGLGVVQNAAWQASHQEAQATCARYVLTISRDEYFRPPKILHLLREMMGPRAASLICQQGGFTGH